MATSLQTDEYLSANDIPHLLNEMYVIPPGCIVSFGLQLGISLGKIQDSRRQHNETINVLTEILHEALNRHPPLTKKEIVEALRAPSVQQTRLANQIEANYIPQSQSGPQHVGAESRAVTQTGLSQQMSLQSVHQLPPSVPLHQTLTNIQPPPWPNTSQSFASQQLTTEPQPNLGQVGQSHQLPASQRMSMAPQFAPQTSQSFSLQPQPGPSVTSLQWTPQMPAVPQLPPSAPPQTHVLPSSSNTQTSQWLGNSQLAASHLLTIEIPRLNQLQPNLDQVSQSHQQPASQRMSMTPQPGPQMQLWSQLQCPPHHPNYQHLPLQSHPGYPFPLPNPPIHRPHESQSFPPYAPSHNQCSSLQPFHSCYSSVAQPPHDQNSQPFGNQSFTQISQDQNIFQPSHHTPYQQDQGQLTEIGPPAAKRQRQQIYYPSLPYYSSPASGATVTTACNPALIEAFIQFVKQKYTAQKVLKDEKWSLSPTVKFINLACIDRKCVKSKEYNDVTKAMVMDGNVDAIEETKGPIKFSEIAKGISLPSSGSEQENDRRLILVEGAPGVGKSTFAWEFCRKWMNGEIAQQYDLVLLLRLRDKRIREAKNLKDLFFNPLKA